PAPDSSFLRDP
uniref:Extended FMRFamide-10 n=2 Tax=Austrophasmatidae TaxID=409164 RepID=FAR10_HEMMO|nr:RecName: Full=Extended FMRFamide-10; Short=FMRFa-10 [Karoophasma biedouwense]B3A0C8.1 RecName: Full=Extended FMRFamide-10; Short=FMRFa-10 [Hemilobophasma montaguense]